MFPLQLCSLLQEELVAFVTMVLEVLVEELLWIYSKKFFSFSLLHEGTV